VRGLPFGASEDGGAAIPSSEGMGHRRSSLTQACSNGDRETEAVGSDCHSMLNESDVFAPTGSTLPLTGKSTEQLWCTLPLSSCQSHTQTLLLCASHERSYSGTSRGHGR